MDLNHLKSGAYTYQLIMLRSGDTLELWKIWYNMREQDFDGGMMHP
jgi:hypothetical protein